MIYNKPLPRIDNILWLATLARPYPAATSDIIETATIWQFSPRTIDFLRLFPANEVFETQEDFQSRCEQLEMLMSDERTMPFESVLSPQD